MSLFSSSLWAEIFAIERFDGYGVADGTNINGLGTTSNGWDGAWTSSVAVLADLSANPITTVHGFSGGDWALSIPSQNNYAALRDLVTDVEISDGYYIRYLIRITTSNFRVALFNNRSNWDHRYFGLDADSDGDVVASVRCNQRDRGGGDLGSSGDHMLIAYLLGNFITVWIDPLSESDAPVATKTSTDGWRDLPGIGIHLRNNGNPAFIDDIIIGSTFKDVLGVSYGVVFAVE